jgi:hypothetical protein
MLVQLLNVPVSDEDWNVWSYHHRLSHDAIRDAIRTKKGLPLTDYIIDPIDRGHLQDWLMRNQQLHLEMDAAVGSESVDLTDVDPNNKNQMTAWIYDHYLEHQTAEVSLQIGS